MSFYIKNGDEIFLRYTIKKEVIKDQVEKDVLYELLDRKLFKRVYQAKIILTTAPFNEFEQIEIIKKSVDVKLKTLISQDIYATADIYQNKTFKDSDLKCLLIAQKNKEEYKFDAKWENVNKEFSLMNMNVVMVRIYLRRTFINSKDFEEKRKLILDTVSKEISELETYTN
ncbi:hypothetical protein [Frigoriflavimonas asaccharolytica]|uniref:Uncharacterized protein n=1 Tax=Frigoriflavimonas asaccharolytica TaxID=2735899 RepID=A0A8J8GAQ8_9FLAO|nr:hypothetical protein [Frigoriflavimonas asaccharolytica]NRS93770.1 hypothetical protein [Frigoriflavimonas asaccharolytica]